MHNFNGRKHDGLSVVAKIAWAIVGITAVVLAVLLIRASRQPDDPKTPIDIYGTNSPTSVPVPTEVTDVTEPPLNTEAPTPTPEPTATPVPGYTAAPEPDYSVFDNSVFVGNSVFEGLYRYGVITHGKFMTKVGLNILSVYTDPKTDGTIPIIQELVDGEYEAVILMFGQNELGWPSLTSFIDHYSDFITDVWEMHPNAKIFLTGLPPFSKAKSAQGGETGANNERVRMYNEQIEQLARTRGCYYITVPDVMITADGDLPDDASSDGMHLNMQYSSVWADHICLTVMAALRGN